MDSLVAHSASFIYRSALDATPSSSSANHDLEPPRKKMRKGTRSCAECSVPCLSCAGVADSIVCLTFSFKGRRRKVRCTFRASRPDRCNECFSRGVDCVDQEQAPVEPHKSQTQTSEQSYSLRERVAVLESTVGNILKTLGEGAAKDSRDGTGSSSSVPESNIFPTTCAPSPSESLESISHGQTEQAPLLSLFSNHVVSRSDPPAELNDHNTQSQSPKNTALRSLLFSLLPSIPDVQKILEAFPHLYRSLKKKYPELCDENLPAFLAERPGCSSPETLGDIAKLLIFLIIAIDGLSGSFDFSNLQVPLSPKDFKERVLSVVDRMILGNDDIASTTSGIECFFFAAKYYMNGGRPRKAWRLYRRGIEFAQLRGLHLSTNRPVHPNDRVGLRQSYIWCSLVCSDRYLSLILGLPYVVPDRFMVPHCQHLAKSGLLEPPEMYVYRLCEFVGRIIDRNQDPSDSSLLRTLEIDQKLGELATQLLRDFSDAGSDQVLGEPLLNHFMHHVIRTMLHLPFALKSDTDAGSQYCRNAALESSRNCIEFYKRIQRRPSVQQAACKLIDFQAFTAAMLLGIHLLGRPSVSESTAQQNAADWQLIKETTQIFRDISSGPDGSVAAQSADVLEMLCGCSPPSEDCQNNHHNSCKITIPYFGTLYLRPGKPFGPIDPYQRGDSSSAAKWAIPPPTNSNDYITPSDSTPVSVITPVSSAVNNTSPILDDRLFSFENILSLPNVDFDESKISTNVDQEMAGWRMDPNLSLDLCLDQGWNLDWFDPGDLPTPP
ncbi:hypothetical protein PRK78_007156 [Emydomyces testavorans]|uniref:Uncharacterized protein n=1 Tax=Emydomyces testavorans TaxID=2070801 RepID=A0AAF0IQ65_9EURO|nr:hypothetical protein PRK78_007156 [Emydomyces testavorans]